MLETPNENVFRVDDVKPMLDLLRRRRIRIDPGYRGECKRLFENAGLRINYYAANGMLIDECGEAFFDAGFTSRRLDCREILDLLEQLFAPRPKSRARVKGDAAKRVVSAEERKARANREKKFQCETCGQISRGSKNTRLICGVCFEIDGAIRFMPRVEPTAEEVLERLAIAADDEQSNAA